MGESLTKRPARQFTKLVKAGGSLRAGSLGDIQVKKVEKHFRTRPWNCDHNWIPGAQIEICTNCGISKSQEDNAKARRLEIEEGRRLRRMGL